MSRELRMTFVTRKPLSAAFELDRHNVVLVVVMGAARLWIDIDADDLDVVNFHTLRSRGQISTNTDAITKQTIMKAKPPVNEPVF